MNNNLNFGAVVVSRSTSVFSDSDTANYVINFPSFGSISVSDAITFRDDLNRAIDFVNANNN